MEPVDVGTITASGVVLIWSIIQTFSLEYLWFVKDWFDKLEPRKKQTANAAGIFIVTAAAYGLSVANVINGFSPDLNGLLAALVVFFTALGVNQGIHMGTKKPDVGGG